MSKTIEQKASGTGTDRNGSLSDRVRSLRLGESGAKSTRPKTAALAWGICGILAVTTAGFGYRTYRLNPPGGEAAPRTGDATPAAATTAPSLPAATGSVASSGGLALQAKGYIIAAHKVQV